MAVGASDTVEVAVLPPVMDFWFEGEDENTDDSPCCRALLKTLRRGPNCVIPSTSTELVNPTALVAEVVWRAASSCVGDTRNEVAFWS